ncbi:MAG: hypothetical protein QME12_07730 [Nanoarchaeota archaeon]|nr:hypothetical protein [Nanoarchaeota archaeon]
MNKWTEALALSGLVALIGAASCSKPQIYEVKKGEEGCVKVEGCGRLCYEGFIDGGGFSITMNGEKFMYSTAQEDMYPCGCHLERGAISDDLLVVVQNIKPFDFP